MSLISHLEEKYGEDFIDSLSDEQKDLFKRRSKFFEFAMRVLINHENLKIENSPLSERDIEFLNEELLDYSYYSIRDKEKDICDEWANKLLTSPLYFRLYRLYIENNKNMFKRCVINLISLEITEEIHASSKECIPYLIKYAFKIDNMANKNIYFQLYATSVCLENSYTTILESMVVEDDFKNEDIIRQNLNSLGGMYINSLLLSNVQKSDLIRKIAARYLNGKYSDIIRRVAERNGLLINNIAIGRAGFFNDNIAIGYDALFLPPINNIIRDGEIIIGGNGDINIVQGDINQIQNVGVGDINIVQGDINQIRNAGFGDVNIVEGLGRFGWHH